MGIYDQIGRILKSGISDMISASISSYDLGFTCFCMMFPNINQYNKEIDDPDLSDIKVWGH